MGITFLFKGDKKYPKIYYGVYHTTVNILKTTELYI